MTDSTDFFADLERQLVDAAGERRRRLRRARARRAATLSTILIAVLAAGGGLAVALTSTDTNVGGAPAGTHVRTEQTQEQTVTATVGATPKPGTYVVAVLNGTTVPGLARGVANRLTNAKYKIGNVTNAATQDRSATLVEFAAGHRAEADSVAKAIDVGADSIQQLSPGSKTIAGNEATVVVTVGAGQNTSPLRGG